MIEAWSMRREIGAGNEGPGNRKNHAIQYEEGRMRAVAITFGGSDINIHAP